MQSIVRVTIFAMAALLVSACADATSADGTPSQQVPPPEIQVVGRYTLSSAAGHSLPALIAQSVDTVVHETYDISVVSDTLEVTADGRYTQRAHTEVRLAGVLIGRNLWADHGRLSRSGNALSFDSEYIQGVAFSAVVDASGPMRVHQDLTREGGVVEYAFQKLP